MAVEEILLEARQGTVAGDAASRFEGAVRLLSSRRTGGAAAASMLHARASRTVIVAERFGANCRHDGNRNFVSSPRRMAEVPAALESMSRRYDVASELASRGDARAALRAGGLPRCGLANGTQVTHARSVVLCDRCASAQTSTFPGEQKDPNSRVAYCPHFTTPSLQSIAPR